MHIRHLFTVSSVGNRRKMIHSHPLLSIIRKLCYDVHWCWRTISFNP